MATNLKIRLIMDPKSIIVASRSNQLFTPAEKFADIKTSLIKALWAYQVNRMYPIFNNLGFFLTPWSYCSSSVPGPGPAFTSGQNSISS